METIKRLRKQQGLSQQKLAEATGLSIRTIQRLEAGSHVPHDFTLKVLSEALNVDIVDLNPPSNQDSIENIESEKQYLKLINLSALGFFVLPFGNLLFPFFLWRRKKASTFIQDYGKHIVNFQLIWSLVLYTALCITPFLNIYAQGPVSPILLVLFSAVTINIVAVLMNAMHIENNKNNFLNTPFKLI